MRAGLKDIANRALYQEYSRRLDARAVLDYYGATNCSETHGEGGTTEILHSCLIDRVDPHHSNGDQNPSACANIEKKQYICYTGAWAGDLFHLIAKMEGKETLADALPVISQFLTGAVREDTASFTDELRALFTRPSTEIAELPSYHERVLEPWALVHPYIYEERGVSIEAASRLRIGFDERENRIVFPHFWRGRLVGWQKRVIPARPSWPGTVPDIPKYRNSGGFPKAETIYNLDRARATGRSIVVVESPMSVLKAASLGMDTVVCTFGAKVTDHQVELLRDFDTVWVWFDRDTSGFAGERKIVEHLYRHTDVRVVIPQYKIDLGDYNDLDTVLGTLAQAVPAAVRISQYGRRP